MNYIEAVRELVNNPKAVAISFKSTKSGKTIRIINDGAGDLRFSESRNLVFANMIEFLLREDFTVVYKKNFYDEVSEVSGVPREHVKKVMHTVNYMAQDKAAREFFSSMKKLFGE